MSHIDSWVALPHHGYVKGFVWRIHDGACEVIILQQGVRGNLVVAPENCEPFHGPIEMWDKLYIHKMMRTVKIWTVLSNDDLVSSPEFTQEEETHFYQKCGQQDAEELLAVIRGI